MILLGNLLSGVATVLGIVIDVSIFLVIVRAVMSWVGPYRLGSFGDIVYDATEPVLVKIRRIVRPIGTFDLAAFVLLLGLIFLRKFLVQSMEQYGDLLTSGVQTLH